MHPTRRLKQGGKLAICGMKKRNGEVCTQDAGRGTDHPGEGYCHWHAGGKMALTLSESSAVEVTPQQAITGVLHLMAGRLLYASAKASELKEKDVWVVTGDGSVKLNRWLYLEDRMAERVAKYAATAMGMGVAKAQAGLMEAQTKLVTRLLEAVLGEIGLTPAQRRKVGPAIRKHSALVLEGSAKEKKK